MIFHFNENGVWGKIYELSSPPSLPSPSPVYKGGQCALPAVVVGPLGRPSLGGELERQTHRSTLDQKAYWLYLST